MYQDYPHEALEQHSAEDQKAHMVSTELASNEGDQMFQDHQGRVELAGEEEGEELIRV